MEFTKHDGQSMPIPQGTHITIKLRSGLEYHTTAQPFYRWEWQYKTFAKKKWPGDIVGYIVRENQYADIFKKQSK